MYKIKKKLQIILVSYKYMLTTLHKFCYKDNNRFFFLYFNIVVTGGGGGGIKSPFMNTSLGQN